MTIKAIETEYAGVRFRSRLEARWAVFFDVMHIPWQYEPEGYEYQEWRYLPDFFLPEYGCWVEVKGDPRSVDDEYLRMIGHMGHMLPGVNGAAGTTRGLLLLGEIPDAYGADAVASIHISHYKGLETQLWGWMKGTPPAIYPLDLLYRSWGHTHNTDEHALVDLDDRSELWRLRLLRNRTPSRQFPTGASQAVQAVRAARAHRFWDPR